MFNDNLFSHPLTWFSIQFQLFEKINNKKRVAKGVKVSTCMYGTRTYTYNKSNIAACVKS